MSIPRHWRLQNQRYAMVGAIMVTCIVLGCLKKRGAAEKLLGGHGIKAIPRRQLSSFRALVRFCRSLLPAEGDGLA